jgi:hypothetical protein
VRNEEKRQLKIMLGYLCDGITQKTTIKKKDDVHFIVIVF